MVYTPKDLNDSDIFDENGNHSEAYKRKNPHIYGPVVESVETLLRYHRNAIPLMPKQKNFLRERGHLVND